MPSLLRVANKRRWDWNSSDFSWLPPGEIPAAPFGDLAPSTASALSVWLIEDDESNLDRIVAALAACRKHLDKFDYALIDERALVELGIQMEAKAEPCPDQEASERWHRNMVRLTSAHLNALVNLIRSSGQLKRLLKPQVEALLKEAITSGRLDLSRIERGLLDSLHLVQNSQ